MENQNTDAVKELFSAWVTNPSDIKIEDLRDIEPLIQQFPYCQVLHAFGAKVSRQGSLETANKALSVASLYSPNRTILFELISHPERLTSLAFKPEYDPTKNGENIADLPNDEIISKNQVGLEADLDLLVVKTENSQAEEEDQQNAIDGQLNEDEEIDHVSLKLKEEKIKADEEKMILENISTTNFFAFKDKLELLTGEYSKHPDVSNEPLNDANYSSINLDQAPDNQNISRYDDDQMPFSFLWWLHKTRKEHADTYQPYVELKLNTSGQIKNEVFIELNHQIIENILHLQSPLDELQDKHLQQTVNSEVKRKDEEIIEKFIREEPQIQAPSPDKLDMENKARKSAEDPNDLVSETLAAIYTEQMLFHKAIDTYKKLSLKFPEKRTYFADQISELEKKIN